MKNGEHQPEKCEGPSTTLPILGIEVDTVQMQLCLPGNGEGSNMMPKS